jgi:hypothetical protein
MGLTIRQTKNYGMFELHKFNRDIGNIKPLIDSMKKHGWIDAYPMHCVHGENGRFVITGGHHRFEAAKHLGIPVKFVVCKQKVDPSEIEPSATPWSLRDYFESFCRSGNRDYLLVKQYMAETGISLSNALSLMGGESAGSANKVKACKSGKYRVGDTQHAMQVKSIVLQLLGAGVDIANSNIFVQAISKALRVPQFSPKKFISKIKSNGVYPEKRTTVDETLDEIERVYNFKVRKKIPLAFMAKEISKSRHVTFGKV